MIDKQKILGILNKESVSENSSNNNRVIIEQDFEIIADEIVKLFAIPDVGSSLKILCKDLNLDPESVLLEYCNTENGFEVYYDEGVEETYLVKKGFIQL